VTVPADVVRASDAAFRQARIRERVLSAVRASPGISTERASAAAACSVFEAIHALERSVDVRAVEEAELREGSAWFPIPWCHTCGCTELSACEEGCEWTVEPGTQAGFGDGAGVCSRCA